MRLFFLTLAIASAVIFVVAMSRAFFPDVEGLNAVDPATQIAKLALLATVGTYLKSLALARESKHQPSA